MHSLFILREGLVLHTQMNLFVFFNLLNVSIFLSLSQATSRRQPNTADPSGELWPTRSPANPACHSNHAPLCRAKHRGLADPAEAPGCPGTMGGEAPELQPVCWLHAGLSACPLLAFLNLYFGVSMGATHDCYRQAGVPFPTRCLSC